MTDSRFRRLGLIGRVSVALGLALAFLFGAAAPSLADEGGDSSAEIFKIQGIIRDGQTPIEGVEIKVSGADGFSSSALSGPDGRWIVEVPGKGSYQVELVVETLPEGIGLRNPDDNPKTVELKLTNEAGALFALGEDTREQRSVVDQVLIRLVAGFNLGLLIAMAAIGISLIFGTTGLNNFAHGEMITFSALFMWLFYKELGLPLIVAAIIAILMTGGIGWAQDAGLWRPLRKRRLGLIQMMIVTIGLSILARYVILYFFGGTTKVISDGAIDVVELGPVKLPVTSYIGMAISIITLVLVALFLTRTRIGKATRAVSDNSALASASGIDVERIIRVVWVLAGLLTGLAGVLYGLQFQASWTTGFQILLLLFAAVTLGGLGTAFGAAVGAMIVGLFVELSTLFLAPDLKYAAALVILILVLLVRPQGVLGKKQRIG